MWAIELSPVVLRFIGARVLTNCLVVDIVLVADGANRVGVLSGGDWGAR